MKSGKGIVGAYFEVLRSVSKNDLDGAGSEIAAVLEWLPPGGYVSAEYLEGRCGREVARRALEWACGNGMLHKTIQDSDVMDHESVRFWLTQLDSPKMKNFKLEKGTKRTYADALEAFNRWLPGRKFPAGSGRKAAARRTFQNVEELLRFCEDPENGAQAAKRVVQGVPGGLGHLQALPVRRPGALRGGKVVLCHARRASRREGEQEAPRNPRRARTPGDGPV